MHKVLLAGLVSLGLVVGVQAISIGGPIVTTDDALMQLGLSVYKQNYCGVCHVFSLAGTKGAFGPSHDGFSVIAAERILDPSYTGSATTPEDYVRESILEPLAFVVPGYHATPHRMPAYELSEQELSALVYALLHAEEAP